MVLNLTGPLKRVPEVESHYLNSQGIDKHA